MLDVLLSAEGFSCSLDVHYEDLGISNLQFLMKKKRICKKFLLYFLKFLVIQKTLGPDSELDAGS
jgi:hypothetical protein